MRARRDAEQWAENERISKAHHVRTHRPAALAVGALLHGRWRIGYAIGEGSFGRVYGVTDLSNMAAGTLQYVIKVGTLGAHWCDAKRSTKPRWASTIRAKCIFCRMHVTL
jgi:hypothetical protein